MTTYTHDNGIIVGGTDRPGQIAIWSALADSPGDRCYIHPPQAEAIHAAYLYSLGLALWEHDGEQWLIPLEGRSSGGGRHVMRISDHDARWASPVLPFTDRFDRALVAYLDAHTQPPQPQPGERWLLGMDLGSVEQPVEVVEIGGVTYFAWQDGTMPMLERVADRHPSSYRRAES